MESADSTADMHLKQYSIAYVCIVRANRRIAWIAGYMDSFLFYGILTFCGKKVKVNALRSSRGNMRLSILLYLSVASIVKAVIELTPTIEYEVNIATEKLVGHQFPENSRFKEMTRRMLHRKLEHGEWKQKSYLFCKRCSFSFSTIGSFLLHGCGHL